MVGAITYGAISKPRPKPEIYTVFNTQILNFSSPGPLRLTLFSRSTILVGIRILYMHNFHVPPSNISRVICYKLQKQKKNRKLAFCTIIWPHLSIHWTSHFWLKLRGAEVLPILWNHRRRIDEEMQCLTS